MFYAGKDKIQLILSRPTIQRRQGDPMKTNNSPKGGKKPGALATNLLLGLVFLLVCFPTLMAWGAGSPFLPLAPTPPPLKIPVNAIGATLCVNPGGTGGCYSKIQDAIDAATSGTQINVAAGTYKETLTMKEGISIYGEGWDKTIIDGESNKIISLVYFPLNVSSSTILSGVKITQGGTGDVNTSSNGGGIYIDGSPKIENTWVNNCTGRYGGGVYISTYASPTLDNVPVWNCQALYGGGFYLVGGSNVTITGNVFDGTNGTVYTNTATNNGGGFYLSGDIKATISGLRIWGNSAFYGGGVYLASNTQKVQFSFNWLANNAASSQGGGIYVENSSQVEISSNIIDANTAQYYGGGIHFNRGTGLIFNNFITNNSLTGTTNYGGGLSLDQTSAGMVVKGNWFEGNSATHGGAVKLDGISSLVVDANTIIKNTADVGAALRIDSCGQLMVTNNIIAQNTTLIYGTVNIFASSVRILNNTIADNQGNGINFSMSEAVVVVNNNITGNSATGIERYASNTSSFTADYNNVHLNGTDYKDLSPGSHDLSLIPLYLATGDLRNWYHIQATSPIGTTGSTALAPVYDMDGDWRLSGGTVSMGADEIPGPVNRLFLPVILK